MEFTSVRFEPYRVLEPVQSLRVCETFQNTQSSFAKMPFLGPVQEGSEHMFFLENPLVTFRIFSLFSFNSWAQLHPRPEQLSFVKRRYLHTGGSSCLYVGSVLKKLCLEKSFMSNCVHAMFGALFSMENKLHLHQGFSTFWTGQGWYFFEHRGPKSTFDVRAQQRQNPKERFQRYNSQ